MPGNEMFAVVVGENRYRDADPLSVILLLAQTLPLALRRTRPAACLAVVGVAWGLYQALGYSPSSAGLGLYVALYSAGAHLARHRVRVAALVVAGYLAVSLAVHRKSFHGEPVQYLTYLMVLALCWLIGEGVRARVRAEAARRQAAEREAVADERARIARELHDVVTHHVTAMVVQAEALPFLLPDHTERVRDGLGTISTTGRAAMTDLRELLDVLHDPGSPAKDDRAPATESLETLIERARSAGQAIEFSRHGEPGTLPTGLGLALQRVVQESLTNALKHAPGRLTTVTVTHTAGAVGVSVVTAGVTGVTGRSAVGRSGSRPWARSGRGIAGMRDRVAAFGGELTAGREPDGGFAVRARLPLATART
ncbi:histidine kinase [Kineosporia sp. J2-2]|uniref:histidine kinase n=2 Tax=Kineosporia corallincola TaxID=2835133 RepID=A0ABS5TF68_9ACTN|nr:histidine kinase [Kineosporia corallincola]